MLVKEIILGAVRTRATITINHFLFMPETRQATLDVLASEEVARELMVFGEGTPDVIKMDSHGRLKILDDQRTYLLNHPKRGNNRPVDVNEIIRQKHKLS